MSLFSKLIKKSLGDFLRKRKKWLILITIFIGILIGVNLIINHYVDKVVGSLIKEFVHEKSKGFYEVEFDEIAYILNNGRFYVSNFKFDVAPEHHEDIDHESLQQKYIYTANIPVLHIDIIDFWSIFVNRKLRVIGVEIDSPFIKVLNLNKNKNPKKISFEAGNLYEVLSGHLNELKISNFLITDGEFDYETYNGPDYDNFKIKGLTFEVINFKINESASSRKDKIFYTDNISLEIKDQLLYLKDSIHKVTFDKFYISTSKNEFGFENFNLTRRKNVHTKLENHDHYEINLPILRLSGIDFMNAYNNNLLIIDSIQIQDPTINIKKRTKKKDSAGNGILDVAMIYHDYLKIDNFNLNDAQLIYTDERNETPKQYSIDHISANLTKLELDTGSYSKYKYGFNFDDAELIVKDYEVTLPDSLNTVKFSEFSISSNPFELKLKDLTINPSLASKTTNENSLFYASIPYMVISNFDVAKAINMDTFLIDEIYFEDPDITIITATNNSISENKKKTPGGLFGVYDGIKSISDYFIMEKMNLRNGKFKLENRAPEKQTRLSLDQIDLSLKNLVVDSLTDTKNDFLGKLAIDLSIQKSILKIPIAEVGIEKLDFNSELGRLQFESVDIDTDSVNFEQKLKVIFPELLLTGINPNEILFENKLLLDTLQFKEVDVFIDLLSELPEKKDNGQQSSSLPSITIKHLIGIDNDINILEHGYPLYNANNINFNIAQLMIDQSLSDKVINQFNYQEINLISIDNYDFYLRNQNHLFKSDKILWENRSSTFSMENISLKPFGEVNNLYDIEIPKITMSGIDLKKVLRESDYIGNEILIDQPKIHLKLAQGRQEKMTSLDLGFIPILLRNRFYGAKAKKFNVNNAEISFHQKTEKDSLILEAENLNLFVDNFAVDSTTEMAPDRFLFANDVQLYGDYLSAFHQSNSDFYNINHFYISTKEGDIKLNGLYYSINTKNEFPNKGKTKLSVNSLNLIGIDFFDLTQNRKLKIDEIHIDNADLLMAKNMTKEGTITNYGDSLAQVMESFHLINNDTLKPITEDQLLEDISNMLGKQLSKSKIKSVKDESEITASKNDYLLDTLLIKDIEIGRVLLTDSKVDLETTDNKNTGILIPDIWFLAEGIEYSPSAIKDSSRIFYSDNLMAKISNFSYVLPDNLSSIKVDELILNSRDSSIKANNFALIPLVSKYDYGLTKGYQSTWLQIENDSISMKNVDFLGLLNNGELNAKSLIVDKLNISVFRDKRNPFPEWQRRPLPQASLRDLNFTFGIDTIKINNGFITYQEHSEKAYTTGEVFFSDLNAMILNLTNDFERTISYPNARLSITTKIFGTGAIKGEFLFDLVDMENIHSYGIDVEPFDLTEFNRILIPSASVQISSGDSKKIIMTAKANETYSYGEMKFYYENLKIQLLNRETETPKGLGNALGSFFANTFIIKSNNPRNLLLRKGDIFFERDKKRAIFNYWTKTFLSGVVSSIGAANNKKKIKKMQDENLKKIQEDKKEASSQ